MDGDGGFNHFRQYPSKKSQKSQNFFQPPYSLFSNNLPLVCLPRRSRRRSRVTSNTPFRLIIGRLYVSMLYETKLVRRSPDLIGTKAEAMIVCLGRKNQSKQSKLCETNPIFGMSKMVVTLVKTTNYNEQWTMNNELWTMNCYSKRTQTNPILPASKPAGFRIKHNWPLTDVRGSVALQKLPITLNHIGFMAKRGRN